MKIVLWFLLACGAMRYNACKAVNIGEECSSTQVMQLECTRLPPSTADQDCVETFQNDHIIAQCKEVGSGYEWRRYASCTDGLYCITDGAKYDCEQSLSEDCQWDDNDNSRDSGY